MFPRKGKTRSKVSYLLTGARRILKLVKDVELDLDAQSEDCYVAIQALHEVLLSLQPLIVYFPDSSLWLSRAVSKSNRKEFVQKLGEMFDQLAGPVVLICGQNKLETGSKEKEKFTMILPNLGHLAKLGVKDGSMLRPLNLEDFIQSKVKVCPSVAYDATSMNELRKWNEQYGEGGSRRKSPFGF